MLVTTFTRTLNGSLENQLRMLVDDEDVLRRIEVRNVDQVANRAVTAGHGRLAMLSADDEWALWSEVIGRAGARACRLSLCWCGCQRGGDVS